MRLFNNKPLLITIVITIILVLLLFIIPGGAKISGVESVPGGVAAGAQSFLSRVTNSVIFLQLVWRKQHRAGE